MHHTSSASFDFYRDLPAISSFSDVTEYRLHADVPKDWWVAIAAGAYKSTVETLKKLNPNMQILRPGQVLKYQKATMQKVIIGWKPATTSNIAAYYNVGDPSYAKKLNYALALIRTGKVAACAN